MSINETIKSNKKTLFYIFIAALLLRVFFFLTVSLVLDVNLEQDFEYGIIARSLIAGEGYSVPWREEPSAQEPLVPWLEEPGAQEPLKVPHNYRSSAYHLPLYPIMLAAIYYFVKSTFSTFIIISIQILLSSATCFLIYLIALKLFINQRAAIIAGGIMIFYPTFIIHVARIIPETILIFWLSLTVLYLLRQKDNPSYRNSLVTGSLIGIALLTSNVIAPMMPFIVAWLLISLTIPWKKRVKIIILTMLTAFIVVSPWLVRNYIVFKEFPLMKTTMGHNLWLGNSPKSTGTFYSQSGGITMASILQKDFLEGQKLSELEQDKRLYYKAIAHIKKEPMHFAGLFLKRLYYFIWFAPDNLVSKEARLNNKVSKLPYGLILISCIIGVILSLRKYPKDVFLIFSIILSVTLIYSVFIVGHPRYRMTIEPYMILFSAYAICVILDKIPVHYFKRR